MQDISAVDRESWQVVLC